MFKFILLILTFLSPFCSAGDIRQTDIDNATMQLVVKGGVAFSSGTWNDMTVTDENDMRKLVSAWAEGELPFLGFVPWNEHEELAYKEKINFHLDVLSKAIVSNNRKMQSRRKIQKIAIGNESFIIPPPFDRRFIPMDNPNHEMLCTFLSYGAEVMTAEFGLSRMFRNAVTEREFKRMAQDVKADYDDAFSRSPNIITHSTDILDYSPPSLVTKLLMQENDGTASFVWNREYPVKGKVFVARVKYFHVDMMNAEVRGNQRSSVLAVFASWSNDILSANTVPENDDGKLASSPNYPIRKEPNIQPQGKGISNGTGFFISQNGVIMTNYHVVEDATRITVKDTFSGELADARIIRKDPINDVAILKVKTESHPYLSFSDGAMPRKGEDVISLGYPFVGIQGQEQKATFGKINALSGADGDIRFLQMDAPTQPGNSGGPLLNIRGEVIGINTLSVNAARILIESGHAPQNINYSLKIDYSIPAAREALAEYAEQLSMGSNASYSSVADVVAVTEKAVVLIIAE